MNSGPIQLMCCGIKQIGESYTCATQTGYRQDFRNEVKRFALIFSKVYISPSELSFSLGKQN
jgi:hypothetical protein